MKSLFFFEVMVRPKIITFIYWLLLFVALVGGVTSMFTFGRMSFSGFLMGLAITAGGALGARIWCELLMVLFKINEHTRRMAEKA